MTGFRTTPARLVLALLTGALLALAFPKFNQSWAAWLVPGLLLLLSAGGSAKQAFWCGFVAGLGWHLAALYWFLAIPKLLYAVAAWLSVAVVLASLLGAWCWFCRRLTQGSAEKGVPGNVAAEENTQPWTTRALAWWPFACAAAWVVMEMITARIFTGFPWNLLGVSQHRFLPLAQVASITGVYGVSFLVVWVSAACALWGREFLRRSSPAAVRVWPLAFPLATLAVVIAFGWHRLNSTHAPSTTIKLALVQPSIPQHLIWDPNERTNRLEQLLALSRQALDLHPDVLVWPEAAMPGALARTRETQELITQLVRNGNVWMVFGGEDSGRRTEGDGRVKVDRLNSAFLVNPAGDLAGRYHKRHLVPFGEYLPAAAWWPALDRLRETGTGFAPGRGPALFRVAQPNATISPLICVEDVFPHLVRRHVTRETDLLLNLTNNGWFGETAAQWQHAMSAAFRAIENGVPLVRCANNGLTCWVDPCGRLHEIYFPDSDNIYQPGIKLAQVPLQRDKRQTTFYNRAGDWFGWGCVLIALLVLAKPQHQRKKVRRKPTPPSA